MNRFLAFGLLSLLAACCIGSARADEGHWLLGNGQIFNHTQLPIPVSAGTVAGGGGWFMLQPGHKTLETIDADYAQLPGPRRVGAKVPSGGIMNIYAHNIDPFDRTLFWINSNILNPLAPFNITTWQYSGYNAPPSDYSTIQAGPQYQEMFFGVLGPP